MPRVFHISDLHIEVSPKVNLARRIPQRLREIRASMGNDDLLVVTGDVVDDGSEDQYALALQYLEPFAGRIVLAQGNHDQGMWGNLYSPAADRRWECLCSQWGALDVTDRPGFRVLALDSTRDTLHPFDWAQGEVGWWQRRWLRRELRKAQREGLQAVVCLHHFLGEQGRALRLRDRLEVERETLGRAAAVLFGHDHREFLWTRHGAPTVYHAARAFKESDTKAWVLRFAE